MNKKELTYTAAEAAIALNLKKPGYYRRFYRAFPGEQVRPVTERELALIGAQDDGRGRPAHEGRALFLKEFEKHGDIKAACETAGMSRAAVYGLIKKTNPRYDPGFYRAFYDAKRRLRDRRVQAKVRAKKRKAAR